jgi:hypothetical protein
MAAIVQGFGGAGERFGAGPSTTLRPIRPIQRSGPKERISKDGGGPVGEVCNDPSWPGLSRPSTPCFDARKEGVDAGNKCGHDGREVVPVMSDTDPWPALPYAAWKDTLETLQLWTQIVGKVRLKLTPWLNHSWHVALYVTPRGLTTGPIAVDARTLEIEFDFTDHLLWLRLSGGPFRQVVLRPVSVAEFYADVMLALRELGVTTRINEMPNEIANAVRFSQDTAHASYDAKAVERLHRVLLSAHAVFAHFRTGFLGKASPVHFFWGSFDLAVTRFSGRAAPPHPGGVPNLPDAVAREAYSHEVSSAGFWPGGGPIDFPAFYSYAYPAPDGFAAAKVRPDAAFWSKDLSEFVLPYDAVRTAAAPERELMAFLQSTYEAAADLAKWDRAALECGLGERGKVRVV